MEFSDYISDLFQNGHKEYLRNLSVDSVIFGFHHNELKVLLLYSKLHGKWALPGGFIRFNEHMDDAAARVLYERTGLKNIYLQQFRVFSETGRSTRAIYQPILQSMHIQLQESWMFERFITIAYSALVDFSKVKPQKDVLTDDCAWHSIDSIPEMILDHRAILDAALQHLRLQLNYQPVGANLLPSKFTMPELQRLYETILGKQLDRRNFQRKMLHTGILKKLNERREGVNHKAPTYYSFDQKVYKQFLKAGMGFGI